MAFTTADQKNLVLLYGFGREQLTSNSALKAAMDEAERFDAQYSTTTVADVQALLAQVYDPGGLSEQALEAQDNPIESLSRGSQYALTYAYGGAKARAIENKISAVRSQISRLMDSTNCGFFHQQQVTRVARV